mgnify:CR=1 FL=1
MATQLDIQEFIAMVTGGFASLQDLIVAGQEMGLNVQDTVEIVSNLQPNLVPSNLMANMNTSAMTNADGYTAPRVGFEEATQLFEMQAPQADPMASIKSILAETGQPQKQQSSFLESSPMDPVDMQMGKSSSGLPGNTNMKPTNQTGSISMSDIINSNLQASMGDNVYGESYIDDSQMTRRPPPPPPPPRPEVITPVDFSYGDTQTGMTDAAATLRSPFTNNVDRQAAQDYMSGIVSNIRLPF